MKFERLNGNGKAFGDDCFVCKQSYLDGLSFVADHADVWESTLRKSKVTGNSKVRMSLIEEFSQVGCSRFPTEVIQSLLHRTKVHGGSIAGARIKDSYISGKVQIRGDLKHGGVTIEKCRLKGHAIIEGTAYIRDITVSKKMRIREGAWLREPRYFELNNEIAQVGITESVDGQAMIACTLRPMAAWIKKRTLWCAAVGWTEDMGKQLEAKFTEWLDVPMPTH